MGPRLESAVEVTTIEASSEPRLGAPSEQRWRRKAPAELSALRVDVVPSLQPVPLATWAASGDREALERLGVWRLAVTSAAAL